MLTESDRIALDLREFQHAIAVDLKRIESEPVEYSVIRDGKEFSEKMLDSLHRQWNFATAEERLRVEQEIHHYETLISRCEAELAAREQTHVKPQDPAMTSAPRANGTRPFTSDDAVNRNPERTNPDTAPSGKALGRASKELMDHRRSIIKTFKRKQQLPGVEALARKLGTSVTALHGMVRGDRTRYSTDTLDSVLKHIGCTRNEWDDR